MSYPAPQTLPSSYRCGNHPDREGIGICVGCRSVVCVECSTKIDRMNYCIRCLQAAGGVQAQVREDPAADRALGIPLLLGSFAVTAVLFALLGFLMALLRGSGGGVTGG